jgi:pyrroloquinoline quinone biosynthesis protein D
VSGAAKLSSQSVPKLAAHRKLKFDEARKCWVIQAPERAFVLDEIAYAVVSRCDGTRNLEAVVNELSELAPDAPRDVIESDVAELIQGFAAKGVMVL